MMSFAKPTAAAFLASLAAACSSPPATLVDGIEYTARRSGVHDAHVQHVAEHAELCLDDTLAERLDHACASEDLDDAKRTAMRFVEEAHELALESTRNDIDRLDEPALGELSGLYFEGRPVTRGDLRGAFREETDRLAAGLRDAITAADSPNELRAVLTAIRQNVEPPVRRQGRFGRMAPWLLFTIPSRMAIDSIYADEFLGNSDVPFMAARVYRSDTGASLDAPFGALLARYAPIIVQEVTPDPAYAPAADRVGTVRAADAETIEVRTAAASVYAYGREVCINGHPHIQLTYTLWYPERPPLRDNDPEAGHIDGVTLRVTLDDDDRPAIFETMYNCGCSHRLYPTQTMETMAAREYGPPAGGKRLSIARAVPDRKDLILPNAVPDAATDAEARPVIRLRAGWHGAADVGFEVDKYDDEVHAEAGYTLRNYGELERLVTADGHVTSMFYDNGLVRGAQRPEGVYFTPAGILSAGQPRQRGTHLIHWDDWDFDDPHLFTKTLRLPSSF